MQLTPNLNLKKPEGTDTVNIDDFNGNSDVLDLAVVQLATASLPGRMSSADKAKLDGITSGANNYTHPSGDGNLHVPATGTANSGKVLTAGAAAGSAAWQSIPSDATKAPLASPALTGIPTAPTALLVTNSIQIANTAFVQATELNIARALLQGGMV